jgi:hypothetical protein
MTVLPLVERVEPVAQPPARAVPAGDAPRTLALAVAGSALAGAVHLWAAVNHAEDGTRYVVFFIAAAVAQVVLAGVLAHRRHPVTVLAGEFGTLALLGLYVASRVTDLPAIAAHHHGAQVSPLLGVAAVVAELAVAFALPTLVTGQWRAWTVNAAALCGAGLWTLWFLSSAN